MTRARQNGWPAAYVALAAIWGLSFLFIKVADREFAPVQVAFGRVLLGCVVVCAITAIGRHGLPRDISLWLRLMAAAFLMNTAPFTLLAYGEQRVTSVTAGLWNATTPLLTLPATVWLIPAERPDRRRIAGVATGFAGALVLLGAGPQLSHGAVSGDLMCFGAACSYGIGFPFSRRFLSQSGLAPVALAAGQLVCASIQLGLVGVSVTSAPAGLSLAPVLSLVALGVAGTGLAYILNYTIVREAGAIVAATVTYVIPVFSTAAGVALLGERLTAGNVIGAPLIVAGAVLARRRQVPEQAATLATSAQSSTTGQTSCTQPDTP
jgi:drug/metabolite transporter (DMT)-like permease